MSDLRTAAQQALEALEMSRRFVYADNRPQCDGAIDSLRAALAQQDEATGKSFLQVAPVQEPVAWYQKRGQEVLTSHPACWGREDEPWTPLYTAPPPPQRKPLTEEEILKAIGWERAEMYMKLTPNFPVAEAKKETLKNARAIERAHEIGEAK